MVTIQPHIIVQARMGSSRLPNKVMMPIAGKPMIGYQMKRLLNTGLPVVVATTDNPTDDGLADYIQSLGIEIFRGSENNVLERYYKAAQLYKAKQIIRITGDNPLVDANFITSQLALINPMTERFYLYEGKIKKLPLGMSFELLSFTLLEEAFQNARSDGEWEHVTPYMHQNMPGNIEMLEFKTSIKVPQLRLTVDTKADFELMKKLIISYDCHLKSIEEIIDIFKTNTELEKINSNIYQKKWDD